LDAEGIRAAIGQRFPAVTALNSVVSGK